MDRKKVDEWRAQYHRDNTSDEELIASVQAFPTREHGIAAAQVLHERRRTRELESEEKNRTIQREMHGEMRLLMWIAIVVALLSVFVALMPYFCHPRKDSPEPDALLKGNQLPAKEQATQPQALPPTSQTTSDTEPGKE